MTDALEPTESAAAPSLPLNYYADVYEDAWYGRVTVTVGPDGLSIDMSRSELLDGPLTHFSGDKFVAVWPDGSLKADAFVTFTVEDETVTDLKMKAVSDITDFSYDFHHLKLVRVQSSQ